MPANERTAQYVAVSVLKLMHKKGENAFGRSLKGKELGTAAGVDQS